MRTTPAVLVRTALYVLLAQALVIVVVAAAVPGAAAWLVLAGFVTAFYDTNVFAIRLLAVPWTAPPVYVTVQTLVQMLAVAAAVSALVTLARVYRWQHGALPDSAPPPKPGRVDTADTGGGLRGPTAAPSAATPPRGPAAPPPTLPAPRGPAASPPGS